LEAIRRIGEPRVPDTRVVRVVGWEPRVPDTRVVRVVGWEPRVPDTRVVRVVGWESGLRGGPIATGA